MSFRIKKAIRLVSFSLLNVLLVLTCYNLGLFLGELLQKM